jgi:hypothetical protein
MKQYSWEWHFFNGLSRGYPLCCVLWWCSSWTNLGEQRNSLMDFLSRGDYLGNDYDNTGDYVKCPDCIIKEVTLHD